MTFVPLIWSGFRVNCCFEVPKLCLNRAQLRVDPSLPPAHFLKKRLIHPSQIARRAWRRWVSERRPHTGQPLLIGRRELDHGTSPAFQVSSNLLIRDAAHASRSVFAAMRPYPQARLSAASTAFIRHVGPPPPLRRKYRERPIPS